MCLCCSAKAKTIRRDIIPGYNLLQSTVDVRAGSSWYWPLGWYGLQHYNDPDFVFKQKPIPDPLITKEGVWLNADVHSKEADACDAWFKDIIEPFEKKLECCPEIGYRFVKACRKAGYRPRDGRLACWLINYMGRKLKGWKVRKSR